MDDRRDMRNATVVEVDWSGGVVWVNVDGVCVLRITNYGTIIVQGEKHAPDTSPKL